MAAMVGPLLTVFVVFGRATASSWAGPCLGVPVFYCALRQAGWATADRRGPSCQCILPAQPTTASDSSSDATGCGLGVAVSGRMAAHYYYYRVAVVLLVL